MNTIHQAILAGIYIGFNLGVIAMGLLIFSRDKHEQSNTGG